MVDGGIENGGKCVYKSHYECCRLVENHESISSGKTPSWVNSGLGETVWLSLQIYRCCMNGIPSGTLDSWCSMKNRLEAKFGGL